ncbi:MAG TPA: uroporphyrinogen-III synthase, partial [bacterium]|nr:uroporphyrinogen-III synthase [bacterium]
TRRKAQVLALRPDLEIRAIRGNVETRIAKVESGSFQATLMAAAGIQRLGLEDRITEMMPLTDVLPAPGQGALAVQCRADDGAVRELLALIDDPLARAATEAERRFLGLLGCGCSAPVAAYAEPVPGEGPPMLRMRARVSAPDGTGVIDVEGTGSSPDALAQELADRALARGARRLLAAAGHGQAHSDGEPAGPVRLSGMRVLVTRAREQAGPVVELLQRRGAVPIVVPLIRIEPIPFTLPDLGPFAWVIFTSANAVDAFFAPGIPPRLPRVAAVGPVTVQALEKHGVAPSFVPSSHDGATLANEVGSNGAVSGLRILYPCAEAAREQTAELLRERGAVVEALPLYRTIPSNPLPGEAEALRPGVDAILFMSGSAVHAFARYRRDNPWVAEVTSEAIVACLGAAAADAAREEALTVNVEAAVHTA